MHDMSVLITWRAEPAGRPRSAPPHPVTRTTQPLLPSQTPAPSAQRPPHDGAAAALERCDRHNADSVARAQLSFAAQRPESRVATDAKRWAADLVGDVAVHKHLTGLQADDLLGRDARVRAADLFGTFTVSSGTYKEL